MSKARSDVGMQGVRRSCEQCVQRCETCAAMRDMQRSTRQEGKGEPGSGKQRMRHAQRMRARRAGRAGRGGSSDAGWCHRGREREYSSQRLQRARMRSQCGVGCVVFVCFLGVELSAWLWITALAAVGKMELWIYVPHSLATLRPVRSSSPPRLLHHLSNSIAGTCIVIHGRVSI